MSDRVVRVFDRLARRHTDESRFEQIALESLAEHLDPILIEPRTVVDVGGGGGATLARLTARDRKARVVAGDASRQMVRAARIAERGWRSRRRYLRADAERLPLADAVADLVVAHLVLPWVANPGAALREMVRVARPGGLIMVSTFGDKSLSELDELNPPTHPRFRLPDMHETGNAMVEAGCHDVVIDADRLTFRYRSLDRLRADLLAHGALPAENHLAAGSALRASCGSLAGQFEHREEFDMTVELVFGHAWKRPPNSIAVDFGGG